MIATHHFQDAFTFDLKKTQTCCVHYALPSGELVPFCVYNNLWRGSSGSAGREVVAGEPPNGNFIPLTFVQ